MNQPSFFIVGAPKCGTTALGVYLSRHPEIFMSSPRELNYFDQDLNNNKKARSLDKYLRFFEQGEGKICGESSPSYLRSKVAAQEIYAFNPEAKIIIMLREPVSLLYSFHSQLLFNGLTEDIEDFKLALEAEPERRQGRKIPSNCTTPENLFYRDIIKFTEQIQRYFDAFGKEQVKVIIFDDFVQNTPKIYRETLELIGANPSFEVAEFSRKNANKKVRSPLVQNLLKRPPAKILELGKFLIPLPRSQRRTLLERLKKRFKRLNIERTSRPPLDPQLRKSLQQEFAPEIERLSELLERDLTYWSRE